MTTNGIKRALGALALCFAAATGAAAQAPADAYEVVQKFDWRPQKFWLPDRELPPPGPSREAASRFLKLIEMEQDQYTLLLRDGGGNWAQCIGIRAAPADPQKTNLLSYLPYDLQVDDVDLMRMLRAAPGVTAWPVELGGCVALSAAEAQSVKNSHLLFRIGSDVASGLNISHFGTETDAQRQRKYEMARNGEGISLKWNIGSCASAGWNPDIAAAAVGDRIAVPGLCPR